MINLAARLQTIEDLFKAKIINEIEALNLLTAGEDFIFHMGINELFYIAPNKITKVLTIG